ncbi:MAG: carbohydrate kinase family protein [Armatimonadota bacterium]
MFDTDRKLDVLCLGIFVADALGGPVRRIPDWRQLELIDSVELHTGGCANNTGIGLSRLGLQVGTIGKVGVDGFGDFVLKKLDSEGIDTRGMRRDSEANTSFTFVMIAPDGERAFFHYMGANAALVLDDVDFSLIGEAGILHVAGSFIMPGIDGEPTAQILKRAKDMGVTTCLDTVYNGNIDAFATLKPSLPYLDYFLPSIDEARLMTNQESPADVAVFFMDHGVGTVGLKMGAEGSYIRNNETQLHVPAFKTNVVDTSGAGDSWIAGFLAGVSMGWNLEDSGRLGSAMGALCASSIGTTAGLKNLDETIAFMRNAEELSI